MTDQLTARLGCAPGRLLVVSPHFDDAVLSCSAAILLARHNRWIVDILTVFSSSASAEETARRTAEDDAALAILGCSTLRSGAADAIARVGGLIGFEKMFFASPDDRAHSLAVDALAGARFLQPDLVLAPMGIGGHVDHEAVLRAALSDPLGETWLYEDRPYAAVAPLVELREHELGLCGDRPAPTTNDVVDALATASFVGRHQPVGIALDRLRAALDDRRTTPPSQAADRHRATIGIGDHRRFIQAFRAQRAYGSQRRAVATNWREFRRRVTLISARIESDRDSLGYLEQYWSAQR